MTSSLTDKKEIRRFGAIALCLFGLLLAAGLWRGKVAVSIFFGILTALGMLFLMLPGPLRPVYRAWIKGAHFMGSLTTGFILVLAYYLVITPTALLKRVFGGRPLPLSPDPKVSSYWVPRSEPAQPKERFEKRY